jgi:energy-coupling factor transporter ATP-binding protein EcfA2
LNQPKEISHGGKFYVKIAVFLVVTPCAWLIVINVLDEPTASIGTVDEILVL